MTFLNELLTSSCESPCKRDILVVSSYLLFLLRFKFILIQISIQFLQLRFIGQVIVLFLFRCLTFTKIFLLNKRLIVYENIGIQSRYSSIDRSTNANSSCDFRLKKVISLLKIKPRSILFSFEKKYDILFYNFFTCSIISFRVHHS